MVCASMSLSCTPPGITKDVIRDNYPDGVGLRRSDSGKDLHCDPVGMRRSLSEPVLRCSLDPSRAASAEPKLRTSRSIGIFPFSFSSSSGSVIPTPIKSSFDTETGKGMTLVDTDEIEDYEREAAAVAFVEEGGVEPEKRAKVSWVERILDVRRQWRDRQRKQAEEGGHCDVSYEDSEDENELGDGEEEVFDGGAFSKFLVDVSWPTTKLFSKLAFLCNMAYMIPELQITDLKKYYGLDFVTSSLQKKLDATDIQAKLDVDSTRPPLADPNPEDDEYDGPPARKRRTRPSVAYLIAASAASYVHSRAKGLLSLGGDPRTSENGLEEPRGVFPGRVYNSEVAACVAASTMTAVVAVEEKDKQEAARDLRSPDFSPCEWFVCDDHSTCTRCFVIQGSDSLASWQANLFFEPTKFEGMEALVHRGIYEAAKGMYERFMPEIMNHLERYGDRARFRFTGHSLGGSLSLLVNLMLLARDVVDRSKLLPVVTFGSPFVFCGGCRVLEELGFDEQHVYSVIMHRDIVPRAFSCNYPNQVSQILKRLCGTFRSHPCLNSEKLLYSPLGQLFILQPDEKYSPSHPFLPLGSGLYALDNANGASKAAVARALKAFLNSPHPLETLSDPTAYGSEGTILRDHDSSNYLRAINVVLRHYRKSVVRCTRIQRQLQQWLPIVPTTVPDHAWSQHQRCSDFRSTGVLAKKVATGV